MKITDLKGKKVTVMGLGLHGGGLGTVRFLHAAGAKVIVTDLKSKAELQPSLDQLKDLKGVEYVLGQHRTEDFTAVDMVVKTPPAPWTHKQIKLALEKNIPVEIDSSLFFKLCPNPIIGVTGTRGKTTTASLIYAILKAAGKNPLKVGIGQISVLDKLTELQKDSIVVFEMSSWRLSVMSREKLSPHVAVLTNMYPDHLNYYRTMEDYIRDKKNIFLYQKPEDYCVLNWDDPALRKMESEIKSELIRVSRDKINNGKTAYIENGAIYLNDGVDEKKVIDISEIKMRGAHNLPNVMEAAAASYVMGADIKSIRRAVTEFSGLPHRLEFLREIRGVKYYNDTAATSPDGAIAGLNSFAEPIILIAGGSDKKLDLQALGRAIYDKTKKAIFLKGEATDKIIAAMKKAAPAENPEPEYDVVDSMDKAVGLARLAAEPGDVVLLSPGAASFGLFTNEFDRGNKFKDAVKNLK